MKNKFELHTVIKKFYLTACNLFKEDFKFNKDTYDLIENFIQTYIDVVNVSKQKYVKDYIECIKNVFSESESKFKSESNLKIDYESDSDYNEIDYNKFDNKKIKKTSSKLYNKLESDSDILYLSDESCVSDFDIDNVKVNNNNKNKTIEYKNRKHALKKQIKRLTKKGVTENDEKMILAKTELYALENDPDYTIDDYKKKAQTDAERTKKCRDKKKLQKDNKKVN